jgi:hypothetical protein
MARLELNDAAIEELLTGPTGPVFRVVREFADLVLVKAKENAAPIGADSFGALQADLEIKEHEVVPGHSIRYKIGTDPIDPFNGFGYGLVAHEGHGVLRAKPGGRMNFFWYLKDESVSAKTVRPTSGNPFLTDALIEANAALGEKFLLEPGNQHGPIG